MYYLAGERIAMVFVALKELMQQMETKHSEPAFEECTEGVCLAISPTARLGMKGESPAASVTAEEGRDPCYPDPCSCVPPDTDSSSQAVRPSCRPLPGNGVPQLSPPGQ